MEERRLPALRALGWNERRISETRPGFEQYDPEWEEAQHGKATVRA
jgi:hypothetical protein